MEEKERFTNLHYLDNQIFVYDNKLKSKRVMGTEECFELLNQQDKRIKELEEKYQDLKEDNDATTESLYACRTYLDKNTSKMWELEKENQQLKQAQKQLAISELEKLKEKRKYDEKIDTLEQQLKNQPAEIVEKIRKQIFNHFNVNNMEEYESLSLLDSLFTADAVTDMLDDILKEYQK